MINYQDLSILSLLFTVIKQTNTKNKNKNRTSAMPRSSSQRHQRQRHDANNNGACVFIVLLKPIGVI